LARNVRSSGMGEQDKAFRESSQCFVRKSSG
jgi:hypothetical protein